MLKNRTFTLTTEKNNDAINQSSPNQTDDFSISISTSFVNLVPPGVILQQQQRKPYHHNSCILFYQIFVNNLI